MVREEGGPKWRPASSVQGLFPGVRPCNVADCPECGTEVFFGPSPRTQKELWEEFVPWYREHFRWALEMNKPTTYFVQVAMWYLAFGFAWIPAWFLWAALSQIT
jgi:hypothetical protein